MASHILDGFICHYCLPEPGTRIQVDRNGEIIGASVTGIYQGRLYVRFDDHERGRYTEIEPTDIIGLEKYSCYGKGD